MIRCCFAGHRSAPHSLLPELMLAVEGIVRESDVTEFYSGGMGEFDQLCGQAVRETKKRFPEKEIRLSLVLPSYRYASRNEDPAYKRNLYDDIFVCEASDGTHCKSMIGKRNRWIVEKSDVMIAYVMRDGGGAYASMKYAQKQKLRIIRVGIHEDAGAPPPHCEGSTNAGAPPPHCEGSANAGAPPLQPRLRAFALKNPI